MWQMLPIYPGWHVQTENAQFFTADGNVGVGGVLEVEVGAAVAAVDAAAAGPAGLKI